MHTVGRGWVAGIDGDKVLDIDAHFTCSGDSLLTSLRKRAGEGGLCEVEDQR